MRNISDVVHRIVAEIPPEFEDGPALKLALGKVLNNAAYHAPELAASDWNQVAEILWRFLGPPDCGWKMNIATIFSGKEYT